MDYKEFAKRIKNKYPQYNDLEDLDLAKRVVKKYPEYSDVTFPETSTEKEETIYKPMKTVEDINPLYLKTPVLIPCLVIVFFTIFIFKKKIKSGWSRILTVLSIFWALLCFFHFQMNPKKYRYYFEFEQQFPEDVKNVIMVTMLPILSMFFIAWAIKWIQEGFKEDKND